MKQVGMLTSRVGHSNFVAERARPRLYIVCRNVTVFRLRPQLLKGLRKILVRLRVAECA